METPETRLNRAADALRRALASHPGHPRARRMAADLAAVDALAPATEREAERLRHLLALHPTHPNAGAWRRQLKALTRQNGDA